MVNPIAAYNAPDLSQKAAIFFSDLSPTVAKIVAKVGFFFSICTGTGVGTAATIGIAVGLGALGVLAVDAVLLGVIGGIILVMVIAIPGMVFFEDMHEEVTRQKYGNSLLAKNGPHFDLTKIQAFKTYGTYVRALDIKTSQQNLLMDLENLLDWLRHYIPPGSDSEDLDKYKDFVDQLEAQTQNHFVGPQHGMINPNEKVVKDLADFVLDWKNICKGDWKADPRVNAINLNLTFSLNQWRQNHTIDKPVKEIVQACSNLRKLDLGTFVSPAILKEIKDNTSITTLSFSIEDLYVDKTLNVSYFLFQGKSVKERFIEVAKNLPENLTTLNLKGDHIDPNDIPEEFFRELLKRCPNLKSLRLPECNHKILKIVAEFPELKKLIISTAGGLHYFLSSPKEVKALKKAEHLKKIIFKYSHAIVPLPPALEISLKDEFSVKVIPSKLKMSLSR